MKAPSKNFVNQRTVVNFNSDLCDKHYIFSWNGIEFIGYPLIKIRMKGVEKYGSDRFSEEIIYTKKQFVENVVKMICDYIKEIENPKDGPDTRIKKVCDINYGMASDVFRDDKKMLQEMEEDIKEYHNISEALNHAFSNTELSIQEIAEKSNKPKNLIYEYRKGSKTISIKLAEELINLMGFKFKSTHTFKVW